MIDSVPHDARPQLAEHLGRIAPRQHVEGGLERAPCQVSIGGGPPYDVVEAVDGPLIHRDGGDQLLSEDVERDARSDKLLRSALFRVARAGAVAPPLN